MVRECDCLAQNRWQAAVNHSAAASQPRFKVALPMAKILAATLGSALITSLPAQAADSALDFPLFEGSFAWQDVVLAGYAQARDAARDLPGHLIPRHLI